LTKEGDNIKNKYLKVTIFFLLFLILFTLPASIKGIQSNIQAKRIVTDVGIALDTYFKENCKQIVKIKNVSIMKMDFQIGGPTYEYGFDYYDGIWNKYSNGAGHRDIVKITMSNIDHCTTSETNLVFDNTKKYFVLEENNKNYGIKVSILGNFERFLLYIYCSIILLIDLIISLIWIVAIQRKRKINR